MNNYIQRMKLIIEKNDIPSDIVDGTGKRIGCHLLGGGTLSDSYIRQQLDYLISISMSQYSKRK